MPSGHMPVKSPDGSPMDFIVFDYLKQAIAKRRATTLTGLWKILKEEWLKVTPEKVSEVFSSFRKRVRTITTINGDHIGGTRKVTSSIIISIF